MRRLNPFLILLLASFWMALQADASMFTLISAILLGITLSWIFAPSMPTIRISAIYQAIVLLLNFSWDVIQSNLSVAKQILGKPEQLEPRFITMPLACQNPTVNTLLANMITLTPGTLGADIDSDNTHLSIHSLNTIDAGLMIATLQQRYEARLIALFGARLDNHRKEDPHA